MVQYDICCRFVWHNHLWCIYNCWLTHVCFIASGWDGFSWPSKMEMPRPSLGAPWWCWRDKAPASSFQVDGSWLTYTENWLQFAALPNSSQYSPIWFLMGHSNILFLSEKHAGAIYGPLHHIASCTLLQIPHIPPAAADPLRQDVNQLLSSLLEGRPDETLRGDAWLQKARMRREGSWGILGQNLWENNDGDLLGDR